MGLGAPPGQHRCDSGLRPRPRSAYHQSRMRRSDWVPRTSWAVAAIVWLAAGPLMLPLIGAIRCRHDHAMAAGQMAPMPLPGPASNPQAPCFCDQMTAGLDAGLLLTPAVPAVLLTLAIPPVHQELARILQVTIPPSRVPPPVPPPPIELA